MLTKEELRRYENIVGFNLWQVEKDYLQHLLLLFLYQRVKRELVFKGGTALQKVFGLNRFSIDLDFTSMDNKTEKVLENVAKDITDFGFPCSIDRIEKTEISKEIKVKIKGPLYEGSERSITNIMLEISLRKDLILEPIVKEVVPVYPDLRPYLVLVMDLEEILAEKIRAIMWRAKPRDLYDLWFLLRKGVKPRFKLICNKLRYYSLEFNSKEFFKKVESLKKAWGELKTVVRALPQFETVKKDVGKFLFKNG